METKRKEGQKESSGIGGSPNNGGLKKGVGYPGGECLRKYGGGREENQRARGNRRGSNQGGGSELKNGKEER